MAGHVPINGYAKLVAMLREADPAFRKELLKKVVTFSPMIAKLSEQSLFIYSDLIRLDEQSMQAFLRQVPQPELLIAWKLTSKPLKNKILANMSERKKEDFLSNFSTMPRVLKSQVIRIQHKLALYAFEEIQKGNLKLRTKVYRKADL